MKVLAAFEGAKHYGIWATIGAWIASVFTYLYGGKELALASMTLLVIVIACDWIAGSRASEKDDSYSSQYGIDGVKRTGVVLLIPAIGHLTDQIFSLPSLVFGLFVGGLIYHYLKSLTANIARAGWERWIPNFLLELVASEIEHKVARSMERKRIRENMLKDTDSEDDHLPKT